MKKIAFCFKVFLIAVVLVSFFQLDLLAGNFVYGKQFKENNGRSGFVSGIVLQHSQKKHEYLIELQQKRSADCSAHEIEEDNPLEPPPVLVPQGDPVWGISPALNPQNTNEYMVLGAPLGTKVGAGYPSTNGIIAPYASILALDVAPQEAMKNIKEILNYPGVLTEYGLADSFNARTGEVAGGFITIDQGMVLVSIANYLEDGVIQDRFSSNSIIKDYTYLLDEKFTKLENPDDFSLKRHLDREDKALLLDIAQRTWSYFDDMVSEDTNWLPPNRYDGQTAVGYVSISDIGLYLLSVVAAKELGFISKEEARTRISNTMGTLEELERWNGLYRNYYNVNTLQSVSEGDRFVSPVDNGWLSAGLIVAAETFPKLKHSAIGMVREMQFDKVYDPAHGLLATGYSETYGLTTSHYGLIYTEIRPTILIAIGTGDIPVSTWNNTRKTLPETLEQAQVPDGDYYRYKIMINGNEEVVYFIPSWGGSMFEGLMPNMLLNNRDLSPKGYARQDAVYTFLHRYFSTAE